MKIAALEEGSKFVAADAEQVAHMLFAPGLDRIFATHPPLLERIHELDPQFNPARAAGAHRAGRAGSGLLALPPCRTYSSVTVRGGPPFPPPPPPPRRGPPRRGGGGRRPRSGAWRRASPPTLARSPPSRPAAAGQRRSGAGSCANRCRRSRRDFADTGAHARSMVLALLLSRDPAIRDAQARRIASEYGNAEINVVNAAINAAGTLEPMVRLPTLLQLFPTLRRLPLGERQRLNALVLDLIHIDANIDVFEFCLAKLLELMPSTQRVTQRRMKLALENAVEPVHILFCTPARCGSDDENEICAAYAGRHRRGAERISCLFNVCGLGAAHGRGLKRA